MQSLPEAIEYLYRTFAKISKPHQIDGCPCCIDGKEVHVLLAKSLRSITPDELASYAASAFLTVGDVEDYLYFLPRILEISATDSAWWPSPEVTGRAIRSANPDNWSADQRVALTGCLTAVMENAIQKGEFDLIDEWMCAIGRMGFDVQPYLEQIAKHPEAVLAYFEENAQGLSGNRLSNAFWELPCAAHDTIVDWFFSPEIARIPFDAYGFVMTRAK